MKRVLLSIFALSALGFSTVSFADDLDDVLKGLDANTQVAIQKAAIAIMAKQPVVGNSGVSQVVCDFNGQRSLVGNALGRNSLNEYNQLNSMRFDLTVYCENSTYGAFVTISGYEEDSTSTFDQSTIRSRLR